MTYTEIIALTEKGFTPDQIMILAGGSAPADSPADPPAAAPADPPADPPAAASADPPADPPAAAPADPPVAGSDLSGLMASVKSMGDQIAALTKAYQDRNIKDIITEKIPPGQSADDILAGLIHPPLDDKK